MKDCPVRIEASRVNEHGYEEGEQVDTADNEELLDLLCADGLVDGVTGGNGEQHNEDEEEDGVGCAVPDAEEWDAHMHIRISITWWCLVFQLAGSCARLGARGAG